MRGLSANRFAGWRLGGGGCGVRTAALSALDGWTGISGNNLQRGGLRFDEDTQQMVLADQISTESFTPHPAQCAQSGQSGSDGDGIVEIPTSRTKRAC